MNYKRSWLQKMDYKYGRLAIHNLMNIIVIGMIIVFVMNAVLSSSGSSFLMLFTFDRAAIFSGQIWRLISFIFVPPDSGILFIIMSLYFYWLMGSAMEGEWGSFKFDVFYFCGVFGTVIAGLLTGYATNNYLNLSLFLAFASLFPEFKVNLFFLIPVKVKYLAYIDAVFLLLTFILINWQGRIALAVALLNLLLFFWSDFLDGSKRIIRKAKWRKNARRTGWR